jgi:hypothetical protein
MVGCLREMPVERRRDYVQRVFGHDFLRGLNEAPNGGGFARTITTTTTRRDGGATTTTTTVTTAVSQNPAALHIAHQQPHEQ